MAAFPDTTPLTEAAVSMHELFVSLKDAGFSPADALTIVIGIANGNVNG